MKKKWKRSAQNINFLLLLLLLGISLKAIQIVENRKAEQALQAAILEEQKEAPKIALTFDDGPHPFYTKELLDGLRERNVKATFFVVGKNIPGQEAVIQIMKEDGHLIGNHTYHHVEITSLSGDKACEEMQTTNDAIYEITGEETEYMRPPFGLWNKELECGLDMIPVLWSIDPLDWTTTNVEEVVNKVVTKVKENDIILLHDYYDSSVKAALRIIDILLKRGYEFVTVDELLME